MDTATSNVSGLYSDEKILKHSKYTFYVKKDNDTYIVYSSFSGAIIRLSDRVLINRLMELINSPTVAYNENDELIKSLVKQGILVDSDTDEFLSVRLLLEESIVRTNTLGVMIIITKQCNFRCSYCGQPHENKAVDSLSLRAIHNFIINQVDSSGYKNVNFSFFGGEPLLEVDKISTFLEGHVNLIFGN